MIYFVYSNETASHNIATALMDELSLSESEPLSGMRCFSGSGCKMIEIDGRLINAEFLNEVVDGPVIFLSRHSSSKGIAAFTVHATGNWSDDVTLGGRPRSLSLSWPSKMLDVLSSIHSLNGDDSRINVTYEATHHGPFSNNPSFFVELGGNEETINSTRHAGLIAKAVSNSIERVAPFDKVAVGVGSMHYPEKFTRLALEGKYAFSHIMSKHYVASVDMLESAFARSDRKADLAVIEWKGIKAADRENILRELDRLGIDYAKV